MEVILREYINNQTDANSILKLAEYYYDKDQYSAALNYYLRVAEITDDVLIRYKSLLMVSYIYYKLGKRWLGAAQYCRFAKAELPCYIESYYLLSMIKIDYLYSNGIFEQGDWIEVYENSKIGLDFSESGLNLPFYEGKDNLRVMYLMSLLRLNKLDELKFELESTTFYKINNPQVFDTLFFIYDNLNLFNPYTNYIKSRDKFKINFKLSDKINKNYSQACQDLFALSVHNQEVPGTYLEIGSARPELNSNSKLLEDLGWIGISIDINNDFVTEFNFNRKNLCVFGDALKVDYEDLLSKLTEDNIIDYLSIDIDPSDANLELLYLIPFNTYKFKCITFEHEAYRFGDDIQIKAYELLTKLGYKRVAKDVKFDLSHPFEDWYVLNDIEYNYLGENELGKKLLIK